MENSSGMSWSCAEAGGVQPFFKSDSVRKFCPATQPKPRQQLGRFVAMFGVMMALWADPIDFKFVRQTGIAMPLAYLCLEGGQFVRMRNGRDDSTASADQKAETFAGNVQKKMRGASLQLHLAHNLQFNEENNGAIHGGIMESPGKLLAPADFI